MAFTATVKPGLSLLEALADRYPENPFYTAEFAHSKIQRGSGAVVFALDGTVEEQPACIGFFRHGRVHCYLEIVSAPDIDPDHPLWGTVSEFCSKQHVTRLHVHTYGSTAASIPVLGRELVRHPRQEHVLTLGPDTPPLQLSSNHRRNLRRGEKARIEVTNKVDEHTIAAHSQLISESMARLHGRGEVSASGASLREIQALIDAGAGKLFQAISPSRDILSSMLVLLSARGGYYHSAGTSPEGMAVGASQFLICAIAARLRDQGITTFNLGGTQVAQEGLARFKQAFGARTIPLESAEFATAVGARRLLVASADRVQALLARRHIARN